MQCKYHPDRVSEVFCASCNGPLCKECAEETSTGESYCYECAMLHSVSEVGTTIRDKREKGEEKRKVKARWGPFRYFVALSCVLILVMPLLWVVITSLRPISEVATSPPIVVPQTITFRAYVELWGEAPFFRYFINSVIISSVTAVLSLAFSVSAAYAFSRFRFRGSSALLMQVVMSQMLPGSSILIPLFQVIRSLQLLDSHPGMVLIYNK